jgi:hypothetical protein
VIRSDSEKVLKRFAVANEELGHLVREIVLRFEYDDFEHEEDIEVRSSAVGLRLAQHGEQGTKSLIIKHSPIDIGGETFEKTVELVKFVGIGFGGKINLLASYYH